MNFMCVRGRVYSNSTWQTSFILWTLPVHHLYFVLVGHPRPRTHRNDCPLKVHSPRRQCWGMGTGAERQKPITAAMTEYYDLSSLKMSCLPACIHNAFITSIVPQPPSIPLSHHCMYVKTNICVGFDDFLIDIYYLLWTREHFIIIIIIIIQVGSHLRIYFFWKAFTVNTVWCRRD